MHSANCLPCTGLSASFSYSPMGIPPPYHLLWNAPFLNHNHIDHNLQAFSITLTSPAFYLRPLGLSDHLFSYSLSDNPVPSMCQSLEIQPRIAQTPPCTELTVCLCFHFLCQLPPTFSPLPSLHIALSRLDLDSPAANIPSTLPFSPTWQKPALSNSTPCLFCTCTQAGSSCQRSWPSS